MKAIRCLFVGVLLSGAIFPQAKVEFEVASVKPSAALNPAQVQVGVHIDGARITCNYLSLKDYIGIAYHVKLHQIVGPDWLASERYDIAATIPAGVKRDQVPEMLQALLADRLKLTLHRDSKEFPVYALVAGKGGIKLKESPVDPNAPPAASDPINVTASGGPGGTTINYGPGSYFALGNNKLEGKKLTMLNFSDTLSRFVDRPVVDMTGLKGSYDIEIELPPDEFRVMMIRAAIAAGITLPPQALMLLDHTSTETLPNALQGFGLKMDARKAPIEVLVVDHAEKIPTAN